MMPAYTTAAAAAAATGVRRRRASRWHVHVGCEQAGTEACEGGSTAVLHPLCVDKAQVLHRHQRWHLTSTAPATAAATATATTVRVVCVVHAPRAWVVAEVTPRSPSPGPSSSAGTGAGAGTRAGTHGPCVGAVACMRGGRPGVCRFGMRPWRCHDAPVPGQRW